MNIKKKYHLVETRGTDTEITRVDLHIKITPEDSIYKDIEYLHYHETELSSPIPIDSTEDEIISAALMEIPEANKEHIENRSRNIIQAEYDKRINHPVIHQPLLRHKESISKEETLFDNMANLIRHASRIKDEAIYNGLEVTISSGTYMFDSSRNSSNLLANALQDSRENPEAWANGKQWRMMDGTWVNITIDDIQVIRSTLANNTETCFAWFKQKENQIKGCTTFDELIPIRKEINKGVFGDR